MSSLHHFIIVGTVFDDNKDAVLAHFNKYLADEGHLDCEGPRALHSRCPAAWFNTEGASGTKVFCEQMILGCYNYLDEDGFEAWFKAAPLRYGEDLTLMYRAESNDNWRLAAAIVCTDKAKMRH